MNRLYLLFIVIIFSCISCLPQQREALQISVYTQKGRKPFDKYLCSDMIYHGKKVPFSVTALVFKNRITSIQVSQIPNLPIENKISYQDLITFVSAAISNLKEKENIQNVSQILTRIECWREISIEMTQEYLKNGDVKKTVKNSRLLTDFTEILRSNGLKVKSISLDLVTFEDTPTMYDMETSVASKDATYERLCGQIFIDTEAIP